MQLKMRLDRSSPAEGGDAPLDVGALVDAVRAGDGAASQLLWDRYAPRVYRFFYRALGSDGESEDLTQEVFIRTFSRIETLRNPAALPDFIIGIAARVLKWELRRRWVRRRVRLSTTGDLPDVPAATADADTRHALRRCYQILDALAPAERSAFVLRSMEGMKMEEVAATLRVSLSTTRRLLTRAEAKIARRVANDEALRARLVDLG